MWQIKRGMKTLSTTVKVYNPEAVVEGVLLTVSPKRLHSPSPQLIEGAGMKFL